MRNGEDRWSSNHVPPQHRPCWRDFRVSSQLIKSVIIKMMLAYVRHGSARVVRTVASEPHRGTDMQCIDRCLHLHRCLHPHVHIHLFSPLAGGNGRGDAGGNGRDKAYSPLKGIRGCLVCVCTCVCNMCRMDVYYGCLSIGQNDRAFDC